ncbi:hypothetical protein BL250_13095 [Erwinia sp. OLTSP20]|uniref:hypothetical protein n=1 Tax=unclassified Erwinia TaxID=2622719 RepID=UPI000C18D2DC|nr:MULTISPECIES: hypothetical protein [unclassified Erwinia]PIJ49419.1 hypothetical protein BV501_12950 [Erwinia sp. OAMSP11]PIJ71095.1 hypothetical protein BK416_12135 [Erwinia sp. OLSSP12]PIJ79373.1 hypothetical protein BLD47_14465 [Erwinia sp. OLCASP19]PIJ80911.1 hypothetical protein BLD46_13715 [Erwinia sp. OLMTSP26]PIJ83713.1 hypothetical protein BLD49_12995 [Erwinia sp. OLMDSP33]
MPVIKIQCRQCGHDRFKASINSTQDDRVASLYCAECSATVNVDDVVWYRDDYVAPGTLPQRENVPFSDGFYILPGA